MEFTDSWESFAFFVGKHRLELTSQLEHRKKLKLPKLGFTQQSVRNETCLRDRKTRWMAWYSLEIEQIRQWKLCIKLLVNSCFCSRVTPLSLVVNRKTSPNARRLHTRKADECVIHNLKVQRSSFNRRHIQLIPQTKLGSLCRIFHASLLEHWKFLTCKHVELRSKVQLLNFLPSKHSAELGNSRRWLQLQCSVSPRANPSTS